MGNSDSRGLLSVHWLELGLPENVPWLRRLPFQMAVSSVSQSIAGGALQRWLDLKHVVLGSGV